MKVKVFDESHEKDLEESINNFLKEEIEVIDIKFDVSVSVFGEEQIYCFSALVMYK
ncbi:MAG: sporulation protein Cse60 [Bacilli bacterium]